MNTERIEKIEGVTEEALQTLERFGISRKAVLESIEKCKEEPETKCPVCGGSGWIMEDGEGYGMAKACGCQLAEGARRNAIEGGLLDRTKTFKNYVVREPWQEAVKEKAMKYARSGSGDWFYIGGQTGSGKTHICKAIIAEIISRGQTVKAVKWPQFTAEIKALANTPEYMAKIEKITNYNTLYIDDLFKGGITEADVKLLFMILDGRGGKRTIISSEYTLVNLRESVDPAISGRIEEFAHGNICSIKAGAERDARRNEQMRS